jgi:hypothetical protein
MDFQEWLNVDEARWKGPVGGAFGRDRSRMQKKPEPKPIEAIPELPHAPNPATPPPAKRFDNRFQGISQRVQYGKSIEKQIFDNLVGCGLKLREPSTQEDKYDKIDGWWETPSGEKPIQIKYRDTGDDILFEVLLDYERGIPGRDMVGKAVYYAVLTRTGGNIVMVSVAEAKEMITAAQDAADLQGFDERGNFRHKGVMLRIRPDPRTGQDKMMAYIPVSALKQIVPSCKASVTF